MRLRTAAFVLLMLCPPGRAAARGEECHSKPIRASGGYGLMEATAKSRARSAWIKKVRSSKQLGKDYAAWLRARNASYACHKAGKRIACTASATPCRIQR
jgi:hypothetical protein